MNNAKRVRTDTEPIQTLHQETRAKKASRKKNSLDIDRIPWLKKPLENVFTNPAPLASYNKFLQLLKKDFGEGVSIVPLENPHYANNHETAQAFFSGVESRIKNLKDTIKEPMIKDIEDSLNTLDKLAVKPQSWYPKVDQYLLSNNKNYLKEFNENINKNVNSPGHVLPQLTNYTENDDDFVVPQEASLNNYNANNEDFILPPDEVSRVEETPQMGSLSDFFNNI